MPGGIDLTTELEADLSGFTIQENYLDADRTCGTCSSHNPGVVIMSPVHAFLGAGLYDCVWEYETSWDCTYGDPPVTHTQTLLARFSFEAIGETCREVFYMEVNSDIDAGTPTNWLYRGGFFTKDPNAACPDSLPITISGFVSGFNGDYSCSRNATPSSFTISLA